MEKSAYDRILESFIFDVEKTIKRKLSKDEIDRIFKLTGSAMMLEAFSNEFYFAKTDEQLEKFMNQLKTTREYE
jgi:hypothetical protein